MAAVISSITVRNTSSIRTRRRLPAKSICSSFPCRFTLMVIGNVLFESLLALTTLITTISESEILEIICRCAAQCPLRHLPISSQKLEDQQGYVEFWKIHPLTLSFVLPCHFLQPYFSSWCKKDSLLLYWLNTSSSVSFPYTQASPFYSFYFD